MREGTFFLEFPELFSARDGRGWDVACVDPAREPAKGDYVAVIGESSGVWIVRPGPDLAEGEYLGGVVVRWFRDHLRHPPPLSEYEGELPTEGRGGIFIGFVLSCGPPGGSRHRSPQSI